MPREKKPKWNLEVSLVPSDQRMPRPNRMKSRTRSDKLLKVEGQVSILSCKYIHWNQTNKDMINYNALTLQKKSKILSTTTKEPPTTQVEVIEIFDSDEDSEDKDQNKDATDS